MKEYIEREAAKEVFDSIYDCGDMVFEPNDYCCSIDDCGRCKWAKVKNAIQKKVMAIPAADVVEVRHANLVETRTPIEGHPTWYRKHLCCDKCGTEIRLESWTEKRCFGAGTILRENAMPNYCPNCGAKMDGGVND